MNEHGKHGINMDVKYGHLEVMDVPALVAECTEKWFNQTLTRVNDSVVRLGIVQGEFHWHKHDNDDEFFFVLEGRLFIDLQDRTIELGPGQGVTVPKSVLHRPRAPQKTVMLMVENQTIEPTGDQEPATGNPKLQIPNKLQCSNDPNSSSLNHKYAGPSLPRCCFLIRAVHAFVADSASGHFDL